MKMISTITEPQKITLSMALAICSRQNFASDGQWSSGIGIYHFHAITPILNLPSAENLCAHTRGPSANPTAPSELSVPTKSIATPPFVSAQQFRLNQRLAVIDPASRLTTPVIAFF
jgi:hypothetical protein